MKMERRNVVVNMWMENAVKVMWRKNIAVVAVRAPRKIAVEEKNTARFAVRVAVRAAVRATVRATARVAARVAAGVAAGVEVVAEINVPKSELSVLMKDQRSRSVSTYGSISRIGNVNGPGIGIVVSWDKPAFPLTV